jgi:hypothetical protein
MLGIRFPVMNLGIFERNKARWNKNFLRTYLCVQSSSLRRVVKVSL